MEYKILWPILEHGQKIELAAKYSASFKFLSYYIKYFSRDFFRLNKKVGGPRFEVQASGYNSIRVFLTLQIYKYSMFPYRLRKLTTTCVE